MTGNRCGERRDGAGARRARRRHGRRGCRRPTGCRPLRLELLLARAGRVGGRWLQAQYRQRRHHARRTLRLLGRRVRNMTLGAFAVVLLAFLYGSLVAPLGLPGVMVMLLGVLAALLLFAGWPPVRAPRAADLGSASLATLPARAADWLEANLRTLPTAEAAAITTLAADIRQLAPAAARLDPQSPQGADIERLLARHLPRFIDSFTDLPPAARAEAPARAQFHDGLQVVQGEVRRLLAELSAARLQALETEGRFLKSRYQPPGN